MTSKPLKEKYGKYSPDSLKKILSILEKLKEEWDLVPKEYSVQRYEYMGHYKSAMEVTISQQKFSGWMRECGLSDFHQLQNILTTLQHEGLLTNINLTSEFI